jgi:integrase
MIWNADGGVFGAMVRFALLCAQRREKIRQLRWGDLKDDTWVIRREHGEKGTPPQLKLPQLALDVLASQPRVGDFVFRSRSYGPIGTSGFHKAEFDKVCAVREWRFHDLRRTARSLMPRAGVAPHTAERILGHSLRGVEGVYDRHAYVDEMADALEKLAGLVERIVNFGS